jgi:hypothetical protein
MEFVVYLVRKFVVTPSHMFQWYSSLDWSLKMLYLIRIFVCEYYYLQYKTFVNGI